MEDQAVPPPAPASGEYKPNIYPIMYWALAYGVIAGAILFIVFLLSRFITVIWFPVFLAGVIWGGFRNYKKQKSAWFASQGAPAPTKSPVAEFKEAVGDIVIASREMMAEQSPEAQEELAGEVEPAAEFPQESEPEPDQSENQPPAPPQPPPPPAPPVSPGT